MSGLILKLRPHEELMINGVLVENGERNARLRVKTEGAHILRLKDALKPEEATTPLKRAYYIAQLAVAGQLSGVEAGAILTEALENASELSPDLDVETDLGACVARHDFYQVMRSLRGLAFADRAPDEDEGASPSGRAAAAI
ncbi:flagellar biosynthesis repressor FlbT [Marinicaulis aureus]|uniref:Flagellar biosynthesis repressor FlbT n=1 Tax=Hyphococcus aureus TaxID=2666033 RepID=A0ABW1KSA4_9PROT